MVEQLGTAVVRHRVGRAGGIAVRGDIVRNRAVHTVDLRLGRRPLEEREVRLARQFRPRASARHVNGSPITGHREGLTRRAGHQILSEVVLRARAFNDQRLHRGDAIGAAQRLCCVVDDLLLRCGPRTPGQRGDGQQREESISCHVSLLLSLNHEEREEHETHPWVLCTS